MKVEQLNSQQIDWTKPQVVVSGNGSRIQICTNIEAGNPESFSGIDLANGEFSKYWHKDFFKPETANQYPIELKLTIESESELCNLYLRAGLIEEEVNGICYDDVKFRANDSDSTFFLNLEMLVKERNLYKND